MDSDSSAGPLKELTTSRARFIAELGERLATLRQGLARMSTSAEPTPELNAVRRRLHALAAAAEVLRFTAAADALASAEAALGAVLSGVPGAPARERVGRILDLIPSLALGAAIDVREELDGERPRSLREPLSVLVFGDAGLESLLHKPGPLHSAQTHATTDPNELLSLVTRLDPDALLIDGDDPHVGELVPRLRQASGAREVPLVAVGNFAEYEALLRLVRRGVARILPKPVDGAALQRTLRQLSGREAPPPRELLVSRLSADDLVALIGAEARHAFAQPTSPSHPAQALDLGSGAEALAALWSAFARIRGLVAAAATAELRLPLLGPNGVIPLAPAFARSRPSGSAPPVRSALELAGRRFVVADDNPAILALMSSTLQRLGAAVLPARDAAEAIDLAERHWPDALISEALLPGLDGFELCRRIREDIALADLPVALICWKDHLLEHVSVSADPAASQRQALDADTVGAPLAECLRSRASLEQRLARHDDVHGRIDGLTPRLLLQLVCSRTPNALLRLQSGRLSFELSVADGRPTHARLLEGTQSVAEGQAVLGPFLGVRAGRFSVQPLFSPPPAHFSDDLMTLLDPVIARARRARDWLLVGDVSELERVELDEHAVTHYLDESSGAHKPLLTRLLRGAPPRQLAPPAEGGQGPTDAPPLIPTLFELARRGGLIALVDREGRDLLSPDGALAPAANPARTSQPPAYENVPALALGEAVLRAVSAPTTPSALRTHPGLAPPPGAASAARRAPPVGLAAPTADVATQAHAASSERAGSLAAGADDDEPPEAPRAPPASLAPPPGVAEPAEPSESPLPTAAKAAREPREVPEAWSSEPDEDLADEASAARDASRDEDGSADPVPVLRASRLRAAAAPLLVTVGAAALAFFGMRALTGGGWQALSSALESHRPPAPPTSQPDAGRTLPVAEPPGPAAPASAAPAPPSNEPPAEDLALLAERRKVPLHVSLDSELLELPPHTKLRPGHGLLEVRTWEPQQIYVDGVFVGNYASRLIPLGPGTYQLRLRDGARDMESSVLVQAGRRTRLSASPKSSN